MGAAILENMPVTRSEDSTLFREISRFVLTEWLQLAVESHRVEMAQSGRI